MRRFMHGAVVAMTMVAASAAFASDSLVLTLKRVSFTNVTDAAGLWQYEVGTVSRGSTAAGQYEIERRVSTGAIEAQNTAAERITLFVAPTTEGAPSNVVMEGAHSFTTGAFVGSVAAASSKYAFLRGADATVVGSSGADTLTIVWTGSYSVAFP